jgi:hypothetical protein
VRPGANEEVRTNTRAAVAKTKNFSPKMPKKLFT